MRSQRYEDLSPEAKANVDRQRLQLGLVGRDSPRLERTEIRGQYLSEHGVRVEASLELEHVDSEVDVWRLRSIVPKQDREYVSRRVWRTGEEVRDLEMADYVVVTVPTAPPELVDDVASAIAGALDAYQVALESAVDGVRAALGAITDSLITSDAGDAGAGANEGA